MPLPDTFIINRNSCTSCAGCSAVCPSMAITVTVHANSISESACTRCGKCIIVCPSSAIEKTDRNLHPSDL